MAVLALTSVQKDGTTRKRPFDINGKIRFAYFNLPAVAVAGDANTTLELCDLPPGAVRILPFMSSIKTSAWGASRTLSLGHRAYAKLDQPYTEEAESANAFINALDVSSAVALQRWSTTVHKYDVFSKAGVTIFGTVAGGTIPVGATLEGSVAYVYE
jgi:hypothetical protein